MPKPLEGLRCPATAKAVRSNSKTKVDPLVTTCSVKSGNLSAAHLAQSSAWALSVNSAVICTPTSLFLTIAAEPKTFTASVLSIVPELSRIYRMVSSLAPKYPLSTRSVGQEPLTRNRFIPLR